MLFRNKIKFLNIFRSYIVDMKKTNKAVWGYTVVRRCINNKLMIY